MLLLLLSFGVENIVVYFLWQQPCRQLAYASKVQKNLLQVKYCIQTGVDAGFRSGPGN